MNDIRLDLQNIQRMLVGSEIFFCLFQDVCLLVNRQLVVNANSGHVKWPFLSNPLSRNTRSTLYKVIPEK